MTCSHDNELPFRAEKLQKESHRHSFNKHTLSGVIWWVTGDRDQADSTEHQEKLNTLNTGLYTGLYTSFYHVRILSKNVTWLAANEVECRFVHKVLCTNRHSLSKAANQVIFYILFTIEDKTC